MRKSLGVLVAGGLIVLGTQVFGADPYSDAERSAKDLIYYHEDFTKLNKSETVNLVRAIFEAEEADRKDVADRAAREAKDKVSYEYAKAENRYNEAIRLLDAVLRDSAFNDKHRDAEDLKTRVNEKWASIQKMSRGIRGANHPVTAYLLQTGRELHSSRQRGCTVSEFETGNGPADCIRTTCDIIEFKPDNSRSKSKGEEQLKRYRRGLLENSSNRSSLDSKDADFAKCKDFRLTIEAYTLLPEIGDDGNFVERSASWSTYTVSP